LGHNDPELGQRCQEGQLEYMFVYNDGGASIPTGYACVINSSASGYSVTVTAATSADLVIGVVRHVTLTTGAYGWVVVKGVTPIQMGATSGTVATRHLVEVAAGGVFVPVSNTTGNKAAAVGIAVNTIASSALGDAFINIY